MTPEDILIEAITATSRHGDSVYLRELMCERLRDTLRGYYKATPYYCEAKDTDRNQS